MSAQSMVNAKLLCFASHCRADLEKKSVQDAPDKKQQLDDLGKQFSKVHGMSSLANLVTLVAAVSHGVWMAGLMV